MHKLMFALGSIYCPMDENGGTGGGEGGGGTGGEGGGGEGGGAGNGGAGGGTGGNGGEENIQSAIAQKTEKKDGDNGGENQPPAIDAETSKIADEEYTKAMVADDETKKLAGEDIQLSDELIKGMLPALKAAGVKPEQANGLANALAREQLKAEKARIEQRVSNCKQMNADAMKLFPAESDWKLIGAGVERFFKKGGAMHYTITHSELGSDPEFLALMKFVGERVQKDGAAGAASGTGGGKAAVDYAKALGIG